MEFLTKDFWKAITSLGLTWWQFLVILLSVITLVYCLKNFKLVTDSLFTLTSRFKKRNCADCALLMINLVTNVIKEKKEVNDNILDEQMNYVEVKYEILMMDFLSKYKEYQIYFRSKEIDYVMENKEYIIFKESLNNALELVLKEIRKSFKENGFQHKSEKEFLEYVRDKTKELISISKRYLMTSYPQENMQVPFKHMYDNLNFERMQDNVLDIFVNAKNVKTVAEGKIEKLEAEYKSSMDAFINRK